MAKDLLSQANRDTHSNSADKTVTLSESAGQCGSEDNHGKEDDFPFSSIVSSDHRHANKPTDCHNSLFAGGKKKKKKHLDQILKVSSSAK